MAGTTQRSRVDKTVEHIVIALPIERNTGWQRASCNCGETVESRVPGVVDIWATTHAPDATIHLLERRVCQRRACGGHTQHTGRRADDFHLAV